MTVPAGSAPAPLIRAEALTKRYGTVTALDRVSLDVRQGEFLALLGPSGCGKTTLLRIIAGLLTADGGSLTIDGQRMESVPPNRRPVNTVFQSYALFPHLSIADNVAFGPRRRGVPRAEIPGLVRDALATVGLAGFDARYPAQLSGGQQQRVALARAIVNRPKVLLLDEPLGALDLKLRKRMQIELKRLQERLGITFVHVTHDQEEALAMADRIAVMSEGRIVQLGSGEEIYRTPATRYVADFIGEANLLACASGEGGLAVLRATGQALPYGAAPAGEPTLMVRPERVELGAGGADAVSLAGTLTEKVFVGAGIRLYLRIADGTEIVALPRDADAAARLAVGAPVTVHWRRDDGRLLAG